MPSLGIMQGRLSPRPRQLLQAFPWKTWEEEFHQAGVLGLDSIEWLVTADGLANNPIRHHAGRARIRRLVSETGVRVLSVCADYLIAHPFFRGTPSDRAESLSMLMGLIGEAGAVGAATVLIPLLETAQLNDQHEREELIACLQEPLSLARSINVRLALETVLPSAGYLGLIEKLNHEYARIYYDTGNAAAKEYDIAADVRCLGGYLCGVHLKDRARDGRSMPLGQGIANFSTFFEALREVHYRGPIVLETPVEHDPLEDARANVDFVRRHLGGPVNR